MSVTYSLHSAGMRRNATARRSWRERTASVRGIRTPFIRHCSKAGLDLQTRKCRALASDESRTLPYLRVGIGLLKLAHDVIKLLTGQEPECLDGLGADLRVLVREKREKGGLTLGGTGVA